MQIHLGVQQIWFSFHTVYSGLEDSESLEKGNVNNLFEIVLGNIGVKEDFFSGKIFPVCTLSICIFLYGNGTAS